MAVLGGGLENRGRAFGQEISRTNNRRALNDINQNYQAYPCVVNKRALSGYISFESLEFHVLFLNLVRISMNFPFFLLRKQEIYEKKQVDPFHRPITRWVLFGF